MDGWNTIISFWDRPFSGAFAVSFRECNLGDIEAILRIPAVLTNQDLLVLELF